jgi:dTDP-4-dehydrorhamnose 3,5-epimerase
MNFVDTPIAGVKLIEPKVFGDDRGFFLESWNASTFAEAGLDLTFVQDNHSASAAGVLRGMHFQVERPQGKLVRVVAGAAFDVVVDLRKAQNRRMLWAPPGMAHGFLSLQDGTQFLYKCTDFYAPALERSLLWNDPAVGIEWPLGDVTPQLSAKDVAGVPLAQCEVY